MTTLTTCHYTSKYDKIIDDNLPLVYVMKAKLIKITEKVITKDNFDSMPVYK